MDWRTEKQPSEMENYEWLPIIEDVGEDLNPSQDWYQIGRVREIRINFKSFVSSTSYSILKRKTSRLKLKLIS